MSPFKTKQFEQLKAKWYKKLEKTGFKDVETDEDNLKEWDSSIFLRYSQHTSAARQEYFILAGQFLNSHNFASKKEKLIWSMHADGLTFQEIANRIKKLRYRVCSRASMNTVVRKLAEEMLAQNGITVGQKRPNTNQDV